MTVKMYESSYVDREENARQKAIAEQVAAEFQAEFEAMCARYKCEVSIREKTSGYSTYAEGIDVDFDGIYEDGTTVRPYFTISFGSDMT
jgi:hypothetical protein